MTGDVRPWIVAGVAVTTFITFAPCVLNEFVDPNSAEAYNNWGRALAQQGKCEEAIAKYREALRLKPNYPLASANLEQVLSRVGQRPAR